MSFRMVSLGKLLTAMYASKSQRTSMLRADLRRERRKKFAANAPKKGGDFYGAFWADAKAHVAGQIDLRQATADRIGKNNRRTRLYNKLCKGFLHWWEEKRRLRNEPFTVIPHNLKSRFTLPGLGTVKVENLMSITIGFDGHRIICPYFCDDPNLRDEAARVGLWIMSQCIQEYAIEDLRLLDVMAGKSFSVIETPLQGDELGVFGLKYQQILDEWIALRPHYDLGEE